MFKVCFRYVQDGMDAEDILIGGFVKVFKNIEKFKYKDDRGLEAWVKRIMVNESLMYLRSKNNFQMVPVHDAAHIDNGLSPIDQLTAEYLYTLIGRLPTGYRTVFNLYVIEGYNHQEIAKKLGIKPGTSKSQLNKAKAMLRTMAKNEGFSYGT